MAGDIQLGPFKLIEPIAKGGMGSVWRAVHPKHNTPVAIKVIAGEAAREEKYLISFRNEVRSAASLDHPSIVLVLEHGMVEGHATEASEGQLAEGSPYLAMEFASGGSLATLRHGLSWPEVKAILLTLLDALAHAHARGVVHRDLKAGNVLVCNEGDARPGLKLTDFGIAHAVDWQGQTGVLGGAAGTLHYMAPEQLLGRWRDYGPHTDLYALGCLTYRLVTGRVPFTGLKGPALLRAQLYQDPPKLEPRAPMPAGLAAWVSLLLKKDPQARYQRAADAAWRLLDLEDPERKPPRKTQFDVDSALLRADPFVKPNFLQDEDGPTHLVDLEGGELSTLLTDSVVTSLPSDTFASVSDLDLPDVEAPLVARTDEVSLFGQNFTPPEPPPIPTSWRRPVPPPRPMQLVGAGLGLYGLRAISMVGRQKERDVLWEALKQVRRSGVGHYVLIRGAAGLGKSALARWLSERAHELGAASTLHAIHGPNDRNSDGLRQLVSRALLCGKLDRNDVMERVEEFLESHGSESDEEALALTELISPARDEDTRAGAPAVRLERAAERHVIVRRFARRFAMWRPVIIWFDDAHYSSDAIAFTERMMATQASAPMPVLIVHTVRDESLADNPGVSESLDDLLSMPNTEELTVSPLSATETQHLVRGLLGLDEALAIRVEERCAGNPAFAVQLVGDWVDRGVLGVSDTGFVLREGEDAPLPDDIHSIWSGRIDKLLDGLPPIARQHLERAAALGLSVDETEWQEACDDPAGSKQQWIGGSRVALTADGLRTRADLIDRLLSSNLVDSTDEGWRFAHGMLRESLERGAREAGRWQEHNAHCAVMLQRRHDEGAEERIGRHLVAAEQFEEAIGPLMSGVQTAWSRKGVRSALSLLQSAETCMNALSLAQDDERRVEMWILRARMHCFRGDPLQADDWAIRAVQVATATGRDEQLAQALFERGRAALNHRRYPDAEELLSKVNELAATSNDLELLGMSFMLLGECSGERRDITEARRLLQGARRCFMQTGDQVLVAISIAKLGMLERRHGDKKQAWELLTRAGKLAKRFGAREALALAINSRAEILRSAGELERAKQEYKRALALHEAIGAWEAIMCRLNLGIVYLLQSRWRTARQMIERARQDLELQERPHLLGAAHILLLPSCAIASEWSSWDRNLDVGRKLLQQSGFHDTDTGRIALLAAEIAERADQKKRAHAAYQLAVEQYRGAGDYETSAPVEHALGRMLVLSAEAP